MLLRSLRALVLPLLATLYAPAGWADWDALRALQQQGATVSAVAIDLDSATTLQQLNPQTRLSPASLSKLVAARTALETWPADHVFMTRLAAASAPREGVIDGDLMLVGGSDATLDHDQLWVLAAQLRAAGVRRITGGLQVLPGSFGVLPCETTDRCQSLARTASSYESQVSSIGVDYGSWCFDLRAARVGDAATIESCAGVELPIGVEGSVQTVAANQRQGYWAERRTDSTGERLVVGGTIAAGTGPQRIYRSMSDPALGAGMLMRRIATSIGVDIAGPAFVSDVGTPKVVVAEVESLQLRDQVGRLLRYSNNYITDVLTAQSAEERGEPITTLSAAAQAMANRTFAIADGAGPQMHSGSGLTPENRISAQDFVDLLKAEYLNALSFPVFYAGLVVPRHGHSRMLKRNASDAWLDRVAVKTGTLTEPVTVHGLAGYIRKKDGGWIAFACIVNGVQGRKQVQYWQAAQAVRTDVEDLLKRF